MVISWIALPAIFYLKKKSISKNLCASCFTLHKGRQTKKKVLKSHVSPYTSTSVSLSATMKHRHIKLMVCPCVRHKWDTDTHWTPVSHTVLRVWFKKYYFSIRTRVRHNWIWLGHAPDTTRTHVGHDWTRFGYGQNIT